MERNPMQLKRRYLLLPLLFLILGYMVFSVYNDVRNRTTAEFNAQQMLLAKQAAKGIWSLFDHYHEEEIFKRADGRTDWVRRKLHPWRDSTGEVGGLILFTEVITERVKARQLLRESEERYLSVFEHTGTATVITDEDRTISTANKGFEKLSGYTEE